MISARADEKSSEGFASYGNVESQKAVVKLLGGIQVVHVQMYVADNCLRGHTLPFFGVVFNELKQLGNVNTASRNAFHIPSAVFERPLVFWEIPRQFNAVSFQIGQVNRQVGAVVGRAVQTYPAIHCSTKKMRQISLGRHQKSGVIKTGRS